MNKHFIYLNWKTAAPNKALRFLEDENSTVEVLTSAGPYKNVFADTILQKNEVYYWEVKILKGTNFKIGIFKESEIAAFAGKAFSDVAHGYALYSLGELRNGNNKPTGANFMDGYGPGDVIGVQFDGKKGDLSFSKNGGVMTLAYSQPSFKNGGYVAAVGALLEDSKFSFTTPPLED